MRFLVVDDHALVREGVSTLLSENFPGAEVVQVGSFGSIDNTRGDWDCVVLDYFLPDLPGATAVAEVRRIFPETPLLVVSGDHDPNLAALAREQGADGFSAKAADSAAFLRAVEQVCTGAGFDWPEPAESPVSSRRELESEQGLTRRQAEVLRLLAQGKANKEIAADLGMRESTVRAHLTAIFRVLQVSNRTEAAIEARRRSL